MDTWYIPNIDLQYYADVIRCGAFW
jgi:hypothetical protein